MANKQEIHYDLLVSQVSAMFTYYSRAKLPDRWIASKFEPLIVDGQPVVSFRIEVDEKSEAKRTIFIEVTVESRVFSFFNNYNYGVPLSGGISYKSKITPEKDLIDIEYALSVATEHMAYQISKYLD